jgi:hypothetical protein
MTYDEYFWIKEHLGVIYNVNVIGIDSFRTYGDAQLIKQAELHWEHYGKVFDRLIKLQDTINNFDSNFKPEYKGGWVNKCQEK